MTGNPSSPTSQTHCFNNKWYYQGFKSFHPGGGNFGFADGSVKFLKQTINVRVYMALSTRSGGEITSSGPLASGMTVELSGDGMRFETAFVNTDSSF